MIIFFEDVNENTSGAHNKALAPPTTSKEAHTSPGTSLFSRMWNFVRQLKAMFNNSSATNDVTTKEKPA